MYQIDWLEEIAARQGCVIYNIHKCRAGWGITWHDQEREDNPRYPQTAHTGKDSWKNGLVTYSYHKTFDDMLLDELERLSERETARSQ